MCMRVNLIADCHNKPPAARRIGRTPPILPACRLCVQMMTIMMLVSGKSGITKARFDIKCSLIVFFSQ